MKQFEITAEDIKDKVCELVILANTALPPDVIYAIKSAKQKEKSSAPRFILDILLQNAGLSHKEKLPICQDTGIYAVFVEIGPDINIECNLNEAINQGIHVATQRAYLRASVCDPITRKNTFDNTPAVIHTSFTASPGLKITVFPKGCGSENMSALKMLPPSSGLEGVMDFIVTTVKEAGPNPCPPGIVGVGIGGTMEMASILSKKALLRPINKRNNDSFIAALEEEILKKINNLGIGPQGLGGNTTTLNVAIETYPCHIASLPVAVNIQCHAARKAVAFFQNGNWTIEKPEEEIFEDIARGNEKFLFDNITKLNLPLKKEDVKALKAGTWVLLTGTLLTGRDQTHKILCDLIEKGKRLPVDLNGQLIYYMGPSPAPPGKVIGSAGPTTSYRMDAYTPQILKQGVLALMGKGKRSKKVREAIKEHGAIYLATIGGAGAYLSKAVKSCKLLAFPELGPEALYQLEVIDFPAIVINDSSGNDYYEEVSSFS